MFPDPADIPDHRLDMLIEVATAAVRGHADAAAAELLILAMPRLLRELRERRARDAATVVIFPTTAARPALHLISTDGMGAA